MFHLLAATFRPQAYPAVSAARGQREMVVVVAATAAATAINRAYSSLPSGGESTTTNAAPSAPCLTSAPLGQIEVIA